MRLYRIEYSDPSIGTIVEWHGNKRAATNAARNLSNDGTFVYATRPVDIPTSKSGLLDWLNKNVTTDNG